MAVSSLVYEWRCGNVPFENSDTIRIVAERFAIPNPCSRNWSDLAGEGRKRFCPDCQTYIHAIEQYSAEEIQNLRLESPGRLCGYLAGESPLLPRSRRAVLVGAALTVISPLMAQSGRLRIRVTDRTGAVIPSAEASTLGKDGEPTLTERANRFGEIIFTGLPVGDLNVKVSCAGFKALPLVVTIRNSGEVKVDAMLDIGTVVMGIFIESGRVQPAPIEPPPEKLDLEFPPKMLDVPLPTPAEAPAQPSTPKKERKRWWMIFR
jgi:hypothetical protein